MQTETVKLIYNIYNLQSTSSPPHYTRLGARTHFLLKDWSLSFEFAAIFFFMHNWTINEKYTKQNKQAKNKQWEFQL